jgi:hypothetical protein
MKKANGTALQTGDLPVCSAVPQPTAPPRPLAVLFILTLFYSTKYKTLLNIKPRFIYNNVLSSCLQRITTKFHLFEALAVIDICS